MKYNNIFYDYSFATNIVFPYIYAFTISGLLKPFELHKFS